MEDCGVKIRANRKCCTTESERSPGANVFPLDTDPATRYDRQPFVRHRVFAENHLKGDKS